MVVSPSPIEFRLLRQGGYLLGLHRFSPQKTTPAPGHQKRGFGKLIWDFPMLVSGCPAPPASGGLIRIKPSGDDAINALADRFTAVKSIVKPIRALKRAQYQCFA
jgi:hypothetical protein